MTWLRVLFSELLDLIAPLDCVACRSLYPAHPRIDGAPGVLCHSCAMALEPAEDPPPGVIVPFAHVGPLARAIHRAKYGEDPSIARRLGILFAHATAGAFRECDVIVPVPLHPRRLARRGFNQAVEIARALRLPIAYGAVERTRDTPSQVGLRRSERLANVKGAFAPGRRLLVAGRNVLIVDDVVTTGATLAEVARAALDAGAARVICAALARAPLDLDLDIDRSAMDP